MSTLIPDASALINLSDVHVGHMHITSILTKLFSVEVPTEIQREIRRHRKQLSSFESEILAFGEKSKRRFHRQSENETVIRKAFAPGANPKFNRGERFMCTLGLYLTRKRITGHIILLTDDLAAQRGFVGWFEDHFRITKTWSSLDLMLYVYAIAYPQWTMAQATVMLKTVNARMGGPNAQVLMKRLLTYRRFLKESEAILSALPKPRRGAIL